MSACFKISVVFKLDSLCNRTMQFRLGFNEAAACLLLTPTVKSHSSSDVLITGSKRPTFTHSECHSFNARRIFKSSTLQKVIQNQLHTQCCNSLKLLFVIINSGVVYRKANIYDRHVVTGVLSLYFWPDLAFRKVALYVFSDILCVCAHLGYLFFFCL